ncbi:MAG: DUF732 domain-containing protein [Actinomycetota bacterium]|nr:DUF732 domain-containing protein [Actinomycetota bacterium]
MRAAALVVLLAAIMVAGAACGSPEPAEPVSPDVMAAHNSQYLRELEAEGFPISEPQLATFFGRTACQMFSDGSRWDEVEEFVRSAVSRFPNLLDRVDQLIEIATRHYCPRDFPSSAVTEPYTPPVLRPSYSPGPGPGPSAPVS